MSDIVYGRNVFAEVLRQGHLKKALLLKNAPFQEELKKQKIPFMIVERKVLDRLCKGGNHQGVYGECKDYPLFEVKSLLREKNGFLVLLDGLKDPQNLGSILRSVDCVGADGVIYKKHNAVKLNATVAKVSCGAIEYVKVAEVTNLVNTMKELKKAGYWLVGADANASKRYNEIHYDMNVALVIGSEGEGLSRLVREECDFLVSLPMHGHLDSLNAAVATGILLYQVEADRFALSCGERGK